MTKESGLIALDAFLALYDATQGKKWLDAASQAATFSETWLYVWNVPIPPQDKGADFPRGISTSGLSIIATGHSAADVFMAAYPFQYYRLYLSTGDPHFAAVARLLLRNTKQMVDRQGSHGYAHSGMLTEALTVAPPRGHSVNIWLPWLTVALIDPLASLEDHFGDMDIDEIEKKPLAERQALNRRFAQTRGLPPPHK